MFRTSGFFVGTDRRAARVERYAENYCITVTLLDKSGSEYDFTMYFDTLEGVAQLEDALHGVYQQALDLFNRNETVSPFSNKED